MIKNKSIFESNTSVYKVIGEKNKKTICEVYRKNKFSKSICYFDNDIFYTAINNDRIKSLEPNRYLSFKMKYNFLVKQIINLNTSNASLENINKNIYMKIKNQKGNKIQYTIGKVLNYHILNNMLFIYLINAFYKETDFKSYEQYKKISDSWFLKVVNIDEIDNEIEIIDNKHEDDLLNIFFIL